jgi:hypothetical protein
MALARRPGGLGSILDGPKFFFEPIVTVKYLDSLTIQAGDSVAIEVAIQQGKTCVELPKFLNRRWIASRGDSTIHFWVHPRRFQHISYYTVISN